MLLSRSVSRAGGIVVSLNSSQATARRCRGPFLFTLLRFRKPKSMPVRRSPVMCPFPAWRIARAALTARRSLDAERPCHIESTTSAATSPRDSHPGALSLVNKKAAKSRMCSTIHPPRSGWSPTSGEFITVRLSIAQASNRLPSRRSSRQGDHANIVVSDGKASDGQSVSPVRPPRCRIERPSPGFGSMARRGASRSTRRRRA